MKSHSKIMVAIGAIALMAGVAIACSKLDDNGNLNQTTAQTKSKTPSCNDAERNSGKQTRPATFRRGPRCIYNSILLGLKIFFFVSQIRKAALQPCKTLFSIRKALSQPAKPCFIFKTPFCTPAKPSFNFKTHFRNPRQPFSKSFGTFVVNCQLQYLMMLCVILNLFFCC